VKDKIRLSQPQISDVTSWEDAGGDRNCKLRSALATWSSGLSISNQEDQQPLRHLITGLLTLALFPWSSASLSSRFPLWFSLTYAFVDLFSYSS
jgi:hypothetical protein